MAIAVTCACGKVTRVPDSAGGRKLRCPGCGIGIPVPLAEDDATSFAVDDWPTTAVVPHGRFPDFSIARILLGPIAVVSGLLACAATFGPGRISGDTLGLTWLIFTVALAGLAASRPRR